MSGISPLSTTPLIPTYQTPKTTETPLGAQVAGVGNLPGSSSKWQTNNITVPPEGGIGTANPRISRIPGHVEG